MFSLNKNYNNHLADNRKSLPKNKFSTKVLLNAIFKIIFRVVKTWFLKIKYLVLQLVLQFNSNANTKTNLRRKKIVKQIQTQFRPKISFFKYFETNTIIFWNLQIKTNTVKLGNFVITRSLLYPSFKCS